MPPSRLSPPPFPFASIPAAKLDVTLVNTAEEENAILLNDACGAEFVQKGQKPPKGMEKEKGRWEGREGGREEGRECGREGGSVGGIRV